MEKTSDTIINELFDSLDIKLPSVPDSDSTSIYSMAESIKKHKRHDKSKKHKKHKKKSKKSKKKKHHSRSNSPDDYIELKLKKNKLEDAKSGMPVTLDVVMETIVTTANEKSEEVKDNIHNENENNHKDKTDESKVQASENDINQTKINTVGVNNVKIIIKNLKESRVYHELINEIQEKERLKAEKHEDGELGCSLHNLEKKIKKEKHKSKKKKRSRSKNRSITPKRHKKRKRSHSHNNKDRNSRHDDFKRRRSNSRDHDDLNTKCRNKDSNNRSKEKSNYHKKSITPDRDLKLIKRSRSRDSNKSKRSTVNEKKKYRSRSKETSNSRTRHRSHSCEKIDKKKLFKIARKNALSLVQQGVLPVGSVKKNDNLPTKTVDELTDFCRKLSKKDKDQDDDLSYSSSDEEFKQPFHHPFLVKDRPNIVMNIRNATQLPTKSFQEKTIGQDVLRQQFPVSSGQIHSLAVNEWVPIGPEESAKLNKIPRSDEGSKHTNKLQIQQAPKVVPTEPVIQPVSNPNSAVVPMGYQYTKPDIEPQAFINPYAHGSYSLLSYETGQFTGHTGAKVLTPAELSAGFQPWVKKDQLKNTAPVNSGIGIHLLQKMGWKPGEGLGKNQSGSLEPLLLDVKMDKRGLVTEEELQGNRCKKFLKKVVPTVLSLEGKHPVSLLNEFCAKRKWDIPKFNTLDESGPSHRKTFIMTVIVNGVQYCSSRCQTKKLAKMEAAKACLKEIGLLN